MKRWAALALALLLVVATYPDYPKPAAAQREEWVVKTVEEAFEVGFAVRAENGLLTTVYRV
jgi:hypothetical protein